jgi:hypothetical protein
VGLSLNYSSSWPWLENHFLNEVIFMPQHQYVHGLLDSARKNLWMINQFSHTSVILKDFRYLDDGSVNDLLRSYLWVPVLQIMMIIEAG